MSNNAFIPGLLVGTALGVMASAALWYFGPKQTYDRVLDETGRDMLENARMVERCTEAYVQSHDGVIPKGTLVQGEGRALIVIGYDPK